MKRVYYDLHLHSCLSPCGDGDMTPYNLVNMAALNGLDVIALTDHNSCKNCPAAVQAGKEAGITVIPGIEVNTSEEIHAVCLFPTLEAALAFDAVIEAALPPIQNDPDVFGHQVIMDSEDGILSEYGPLLINACDISIMDLPALALKHRGVCFPAHIDRSSYSILASLGAIPPECGFHAAEISRRGDEAALLREQEALRGMLLLGSSDAHYLEDISERGAWLFLEDAQPHTVVDALRTGAAEFMR